MMTNKDSVFEAFCGPGGMGLGFAKYFNIEYAIDIKDEAVDTYRANHPETSVQKRDVRNVSGVRGDYDGLGGVIGGPPCQSFSKLNHRRIADDPRNFLMVEFMRLVEEIKPKFFVLENVPTAPAPLKFQVVSIGKTLGYDVESLYLNAADYGAAQNRKRWVAIGVKDGLRKRPLETSAPKTVREAFSTVKENWGMANSKPETVERFANAEPGKWSAAVSPGKFKNTIKLEWDFPSPPVVNVRKVYMIIPDENRNISLAEAAALQGFPSDYIWKGNAMQVAQMIANAMPSELGASIARSLSGVAA